MKEGLTWKPWLTDTTGSRCSQGRAKEDRKSESCDDRISLTAFTPPPWACPTITPNTAPTYR